MGRKWFLGGRSATRVEHLLCALGQVLQAIRGHVVVLWWLGLPGLSPHGLKTSACVLCPGVVGVSAVKIWIVPDGKRHIRWGSPVSAGCISPHNLPELIPHTVSLAPTQSPPNHMHQSFNATIELVKRRLGRCLPINHPTPSRSLNKALNLTNKI